MIIVIKICKYCHKEYEYIPSKRNYTYCSKECAYNGNRAIAKEKAVKSFIPKIKRCHTCGKEFTTVYGGNKAYCSDQCKLEHQRCLNQYHAKIEEHAKERMATCKQCGKVFVREYHTRGMKQFCCKECYAKYTKLNNGKSEPLQLLYQGVCEICGKPFETTNPKKTCCSKECSYKANIQRAVKRQHDRNVANYKPKLIRCKECGTEFATTFGDRRSSFCSIDCMHKWCSKQGNHNREMRLRGALVDKDITLKRVAQRDKDICYLCGHPVDWNEHVIPIAKGGKHAWNNVRLAHCHCNSLKGDKILL